MTKFQEQFGVSSASAKNVIKNVQVIESGITSPIFSTIVSILHLTGNTPIAIEVFFPDSSFFKNIYTFTLESLLKAILTAFTYSFKARTDSAAFGLNPSKPW